MGFEPTTSCILNGISYRYATSVHPLVIFVVRTRYLYTEQDNNEARVLASLSRPGPGPRDGGTAGPHARLSRPVPCPCALLSRPGPGPRAPGRRDRPHANLARSPVPARFSLVRAPGPWTAGLPARLSRPVPGTRALLSRPGPGPLDGGTARALYSPCPWSPVPCHSACAHPPPTPALRLVSALASPCGSPAPFSTSALAGPIGDSGHMTHPGHKSLRLYTMIEWPRMAKAVVGPGPSRTEPRQQQRRRRRERAAP